MVLGGQCVGGVRLSWAGWAELADTGWKLRPWVVLQDMCFSLTSTFIHLQQNAHTYTEDDDSHSEGNV